MVLSNLLVIFVKNIYGSIIIRLKVNCGIIISTGTFHKNDREEAKMIGNVKLWDNHDLSMSLDEIHGPKLNGIIKWNYL